MTMAGADGLMDAVAALAASPSLLVALDFDGTLAPEVDDPEHARALPQARTALLRLTALPNTRVALVSGRAMQSLVHVSEAPAGMLLVGSHGVEYRLDTPDTTIGLTDHDRAQVDRLGDVLEAAASGFDNVWIETKPAGFAMHTRLATVADAAAAQATARAATRDGFDGLTVRGGKNIVEFSVLGATKGDAIMRLREYASAAAVLFAGDDVTDEDAFRALGPRDVGVKCGAGETAASFRVADPAAVAALLTELADRRAHPL